MKSRKINTLVLSVLLFLVFLATSIGNGQIIGSKQIHSTASVNVHGRELYTVAKDGIYTVLSDSGGEITRNTNAITIINQGISLANTIGGSVLITNASYTLTDNIDMKSYVTVILQLGVTLTVSGWNPTSRQGIIDFSGVTNTHLIPETDPLNEASYPKIIGGGATNEIGVWMQGTSASNPTTYCSVGKIEFSNLGGYAIGLFYADQNEINGTYAHGFAKSSTWRHGATLRGYTSYNKLVNLHVDAEKGQYAQHPLYLGGEGPVTYNEIRGGVYENSAISHATYWCAEPSGDIVAHNVCVGATFRGCRGSGYSCGLKLNSATDSRIGIEEDGTLNPVMLIDCSLGLEVGDGNANAGGCHGNVVYANIRNCRRGAEFSCQSADMNVENNEVHLDIDVDLINYPATGEVGYIGFDFAWHPATNTFVQNNALYLKIRNFQHGVVFTGWDSPMTETREARYNTFYLDVDAISGHAIYWISGCGGYGRYNTFNGYWHSNLTGNCPTVPNANYVYTDDTAWMANIATNTFNPA